MASQLEIANWALMLLGETRLSGLSDNTDNAEAINAGWGIVRDTLLTASAWHFAIERASLAADADEPEWGFEYQYTVASNVVRVLQVSEFYPGPDMSDNRTTDDALYRHEGEKILTNLGAPLSVKWLVNDKAVGTWHPAFAKLMACDLAEYLAARTTQSEAVAERIAAQRMQAWMLAATTNAIEDPSDERADDSWMAAHNG